MIRIRPGHIGFLLALLAASPLLSLNPTLSIGQYLHTSWTQEEGSALPPIQAIAQTADGYLWLGTGKGLIRFDGMRFVEWSPASGPALPSGDIRCLRASPDGSLWVGTASGVCRLERGKIRRYPVAEQAPCRVVISLLEDSARRLWMLNDCPGRSALTLLSPDGSVKVFGAQDGLPEQMIRTLFQDREGKLWIGASHAVCRWLPGSPADCFKEPGLDPLSIVQATNGSLLIADGNRKEVLRLSDGHKEIAGPRLRDSSFMRGVMVRDRDGSVWIGTAGQGLLRLHADSVDRFTRADGLSSNLIKGLLEDQEGVLWVATARGVDRIRDPKVLQFSTLNGLSGDLINAVYGARDGATWVGTAGAGLNRVIGQQVTRYSVADGLPNAAVASLYEDESRRLWVGTSAGLAVQSGGRFVEVLTADGQHIDRAFNISGNNTGGMLLADTTRGLFTIRGQVAHPVAPPGLEGRDIYRLLLARDGAVWLGHFRGGVSVVREGTVTHYDAGRGPAGGPVRALYQDHEGAIWVGTGEGLSRFQDARWTTWTAAQGLPEGGVQSIVEDAGDGLWLMTPTGVMRLSRTSLKERVTSLSYVLYGRTEGLRLANAGSMANPRLTRSRDGRLWVCTEDGVAVIDPARVRSNPVPPPVVIEQATIDGKALDINSAGEVSFRGRDLQITYTGISLMVPERVHFRYRMHGLDTHWHDAGTTRNVAYANLSPGPYRFQVIASNNDGVWNNVGAELPLRLVPYFYQTRWFALACLGSLLLLAWCIHWLKVRRLVSRFQLIAAERTRFTRELHDSLLQGFSGVVYQLEAAARQFEAAPEVSKQRLTRALDQADESLREARQMILSMRIPALENSTLPEAVSATTRKIVEGMPVEFDFRVTGRVRQGHYDLEANVFLIVREAVTNAVNHSSAGRIGVELNYIGSELRLRVKDDGVGFDRGTAIAKTGHWGLRGMQERAKQIGGAFVVESAPGRGTMLEVSVPWKK